MIRAALAQGVEALHRATDWLIETYPANAKAAAAGSVPYLQLFGTVTGGWLLARSALTAKLRLDEKAQDHDFYRAKLATARFYADHVLPQAPALKQSVVNGAPSTLALEEAQF